MKLIHRGKVRDVFEVDDKHLLLVATDRISAFDVVLPTPIPDKGTVLAQLSAFWFTQTSNLIENHMVRVDRNEMLCRKAKRLDVECVVRGYLAGSAWSEYRKSGTLFGRPAPVGLRDSDRLDEPIFTPTTKAETGHDEPMTFAQVEDLVGSDMAARLRDTTLGIYAWARDYAAQRGIILADTKLEFGLIDDRVVLIDELLTPDSSRFWPANEYAPGRSQPSFDKQYVRDFLEQSGWNKEPPAPSLPQKVVDGTRSRYLEAYRRLVGRELGS